MCILSWKTAWMQLCIDVWRVVAGGTNAGSNLQKSDVRIMTVKIFVCCIVCLIWRTHSAAIGFFLQPHARRWQARTFLSQFEVNYWMYDRHLHLVFRFNFMDLNDAFCVTIGLLWVDHNIKQDSSKLHHRSKVPYATPQRYSQPQQPGDSIVQGMVCTSLSVSEMSACPCMIGGKKHKCRPALCNTSVPGSTAKVLVWLKDAASWKFIS